MLLPKEFKPIVKLAKGQLISKCLFDVSNSPTKQT